MSVPDSSAASTAVEPSDDRPAGGGPGKGTAMAADAARRVTWALDFTSFKLRSASLAAAGCVLAFAVGLWNQGGLPRTAAVLLTVDLIVQALPWRLPRAERSMPSLWVEAVAGLSCLVAFALIALGAGASWSTRLPAWPWWPVAVAVGAALIAIGGMDLRLLLDGTMAFLLGPIRRGHGAARIVTAGILPLGEEAMFRGTILGAAAVARSNLGLLGAAAFVAWHHTRIDGERREAVRTVATEMGGAVAFLVLTLLSGSVYPALAAHLLNNTPQLILEFQRSRGAEND